MGLRVCGVDTWDSNGQSYSPTVPCGTIGQDGREWTHGIPKDSPTVPFGTIGHMGLGCMEWTHGIPKDSPTVPCSAMDRGVWSGHMVIPWTVLLPHVV